MHVEVLTRGPVHEAFAEAAAFQPQPGVVIGKAPPAPIEELPPVQRPVGNHIAWIPGYPAWDDERADFIWVSGVWREVPPGRQWIPGYWAQTELGFQWTYGYWASSEATEVEYFPQPPLVIDQDPTVLAPSPDHTWVPGCWVWQRGRYAWRHGQWVHVHPDWDWVPAHYVWSPRGYVFVEGYWDYSVEHRGVLFAPVHFDTIAYGHAGFHYSPATVIDVNVFSEHLFLHVNHSRYYFGDYYEVGYQNSGFLPAFSFHASRGYDPIYARARWVHRNDRDWDTRIEANFAYRRAHVDARPPRTFSAQLQVTAGKTIANQKTAVIAKSLDQLSKSGSASVRFQRVDPQERKALAARGKQLQEFSAARRTLETDVPAGWAAKSVGAGRAKVKMPDSPVAARKIPRNKSRDRATGPDVSAADSRSGAGREKITSQPDAQGKKPNMKAGRAGDEPARPEVQEQRRRPSKPRTVSETEAPARGKQRADREPRAKGQPDGPASKPKEQSKPGAQPTQKRKKP